MKKVLIIDDELKILDIYRRLLVQAGIITRVANDATQATQILIRESLDVILVDLQMPGIDGGYIAEIIREYNPEAKIIVSSVYPIEQQRKKVLKATDYFDKSEGPYKLLEKVLNVLIQEPVSETKV